MTAVEAGGRRAEKNKHKKIYAAAEEDGREERHSLIGPMVMCNAISAHQMTTLTQ